MTPTDPKFGAIYSFSGAFIDTGDMTNQYVSRGNEDYSYINGWKFDASRSNPIYGNNVHVTPCNASIKVWQRVS